MRAKEQIILLLVISAVVLLAYYDSFSNSFLYDDYPFIVENKAIRDISASGIRNIFTEKYSVSSDKALAGDIWRPLTTLSFAIDYRLWGLDPRPYHIENTLLHLANAMLVYAMALMVTASAAASVIAALIFSVHPAQTEAVAWVSGRANVLFLFFYLLGLISHINDRKSGKAAAPNYAFCLLFFAAALLSKEMAVTLPAVCILYDFFIAGRRDVKKYVGYYWPFALIGAWYIAARYSVLGSIAQKGQWWGDTISYHTLTMIKAMAGYLRILLLPTNLRIYYPIEISKTLFDPETAVALAVLAGLGYLVYLSRRSKKALFFFFWFAVTLAPVSNIIPFKAIMAERFLYLPLIAFAAIIGLGLSKITDAKNVRPVLKYWLWGAFVVLVSYYVMATVSRNVEWRDELVFYMQEASRTPDFPKSRYNLGYAYYKKAQSSGNLDKESVAYYLLAIEQFKQAVELNPKVQLTRAALANTYGTIGQYAQAIDNYKKALSINEDSDIYNNLAVAYGRTGQDDKAVRTCKRAIFLTPDHEYAWINLGNSYDRAGFAEKASRARAWSKKLSAKKESAGGDA